MASVVLDMVDDALKNNGGFMLDDEAHGTDVRPLLGVFAALCGGPTADAVAWGDAGEATAAQLDKLGHAIVKICELAILRDPYHVEEENSLPNTLTMGELAFVRSAAFTDIQASMGRNSTSRTIDAALDHVAAEGLEELRRTVDMARRALGAYDNAVDTGAKAGGALRAGMGPEQVEMTVIIASAAKAGFEENRDITSLPLRRPPPVGGDDDVGGGGGGAEGRGFRV
jgi:hypothetical protein